MRAFRSFDHETKTSEQNGIWSSDWFHENSALEQVPRAFCLQGEQDFVHKPTNFVSTDYERTAIVCKSIVTG